MNVQIWIVDDDGLNMDEELNINTGNHYHLVDFWFRDSELSCFWIDIEKNKETDSRDIFFSIGSVSYRTPYKKILAEKFLKIIESHDKIISIRYSTE